VQSVDEAFELDRLDEEPRSRLSAAARASAAATGRRAARRVRARADNRTMEDASPALPPLPDRLSVDPRSPHHVAAVFEHPIGVRLNGKERHDVEEYCISEGWVKVPAGKTLDRHGRPLLLTLKGKVEAYYRAPQA
jgi:hypothetical protein